MVSRDKDVMLPHHNPKFTNKLNLSKPVIDNNSPRYYSPLVNPYKPKTKSLSTSKKIENPLESKNGIERLQEIYRRKEPIISHTIRSLHLSKRLQDARSIDTQNKKQTRHIRDVKPRHAQTEIMKVSSDVLYIQVTKYHDQIVKNRQIRSGKPVSSMFKRSLSRNIESANRKDIRSVYLQQLESRKNLSKTVSQVKMLRSSPLRQVFDSSYVSHISSITPEPTSYYRERKAESTVNTSYL